MDQEQGNAPAEGPRALSDILGRREPEPLPQEPAGQPEPQAEAPTQPETGDEAKPEQPRDERGKFVVKPAVPPTAEKDAEQGRIAAVKAEREKRQALEREVAELRARLTAPQAPPAHQAPQQAPAQPAVPLTDLMFQEPDRFVQTLQQRQDDAMLQTRIAMSEAVARREPDYADAEKAVEAYARSHPKRGQEVAAEIRGHAAPALWALDFGRKLLAHQKWAPLMQQHSDPEAFIAAEVERRMQEQSAQQQPQQPDQSPAPRLPTSLAGARAAQGRTASTWSGPRPLDAILGQRR